MYAIIKAKIVNGHTGRPMENVNISITDSTGNLLPINGETIGRTSNSDGRFILPVAKEDDVFITFSFVGFTPFTLPAASAAKMKVFKMQSKNQELPDTTVISPKPKSGISDNKPSKMWAYVLGGSALFLTAALIYTLNKK